MSKIVEINAIPIRLPWRRQYSTSAGAYPNERVVVHIITDDGHQGWAEGMTSPAYGETATTVTHVIQERLAPAIKARPDPFLLARHATAMDKAIKHHPMAKAAVEVALYDLASRMVGLPLNQFLGSTGITEIELSWPVGMASVPEMVQDAEVAVASGYRSLKIKIGGRDPRIDVEAVRAIRKAVGEDIKMRVDANGECGSALREVKLMTEANLDLVEQPARTAAGLRDFRQALDTPIMADESVTSPEEAMDLARAGAVDVLKIQVRHQGGFQKCRAIASIAAAAGLRVYSEGPIETSLGTAASAHLIASVPEVDLSLRPLLGMGLDLFGVDLASNPVEITSGVLRVPTGPGLGVDVNTRLIEELRLDKVTA